MSSPSLAGRPVHGVLLDYGLTLVTYSRPDAALRRAYVRIAELLDGRSGDPAVERQIEAVHGGAETAVRTHAGSGTAEEVDIATIYAAAYAAAGRPLSPPLLDEVMRIEQEAWWQGMHVGPAVPETLHRLRAAGLRLGLCSNAPYRVESLRGQLAHLDLARRLDSLTFSAEVGWRKPATELFGAALRALGTSAETTVMVGDAVHEDVGGARAAGMRVIRTREFRDDPDRSAQPDLTIDRFSDLPAALGLSNACS